MARERIDPVQREKRESFEMARFSIDLSSLGLGQLHLAYEAYGRSLDKLGANLVAPEAWVALPPERPASPYLGIAQFDLSSALREITDPALRAMKMTLYLRKSIPLQAEIPFTWKERRWLLGLERLGIDLLKVIVQEGDLAADGEYGGRYGPVCALYSGLVLARQYHNPALRSELSEAIMEKLTGISGDWGDRLRVELCLDSFTSEMEVTVPLTLRDQQPLVTKNAMRVFIPGAEARLLVGDHSWSIRIPSRENYRDETNRADFTIGGIAPLPDFAE
jgi:hypothetical protein